MIQTPRQLPKMMAWLFAGFLSIFAADVFEGQPFSALLIAGLLIHLLPSFLILFFAWLAGRNAVAGACCFMLVGVAYIAFTIGRFPISTQLLIGGPPILIGLLFLNNHFAQKSIGSIPKNK
jgi:hypothetical protein